VVLDFLGGLDGIFVSSKNVPSSVFLFRGRSLVKILNRKRAMSMPWGTPAVAIWELDKAPLIFVTNVRWFR